MLFASKWMEVEIIMVSEVSQIQMDKNHIFPRKLGLKDKRTHKYTYTITDREMEHECDSVTV
jgi:hypothetical protein